MSDEIFLSFKLNEKGEKIITDQDGRIVADVLSIITHTATAEFDTVTLEFYDHNNDRSIKYNGGHQ
jgi:hypothetical protein